LTNDRINALRALQVERGWDATAPTTPLPALKPG
jgi:hypothetical protein